MLRILTLLYTIICLFFVCCSHINLLVAGKRKYNHKTLRDKCQALKDLKKGTNKKDVAVKYGVSMCAKYGVTNMSPLSTSVKNKEKLRFVKKGATLSKKTENR